MNNTSKSLEVNKKVYSGGFNSTINVNSKGAFGNIFLKDKKYMAKIKSVYVKINGKKYKCKINKKEYEYATTIGNEMTEYTIMCGYNVDFPLQKIGTVVTLCYTDSNEVTQSKSTTIENIPPQISVDRISTSSKKVTGKTTPNSSVVITIGSKKYKCKSKKNGSFSVNIKSSKPGTKVIISVAAPGGHKSNKTLKVNTDYGYVDLNDYVFENDTTISLKTSQLKKGDKITVKIGNKTYKKNISQNMKSQVIKIPISKAKLGSKIIIKLIDKYGKTKDKSLGWVYSGIDVKIGMTSTQALNTTWGEPLRKEYYSRSGVEEWTFFKGGAWLYAYLKNGRVRDVQIIYY